MPVPRPIPRPPRHRNRHRAPPRRRLVTAAGSSAHTEGAFSGLPGWASHAARIADARLAGAACAGHAPLFDLDLPGETDTDRAHRHQTAARICRRCPVRDACRANAHQQHQPAGIWAGHVYDPNQPGTITDIPPQP
ncbi:WhiB family transcriptional regulator [Nocardia cyriacigeorgica]|uniref:WhiB family transcriptional regulator n=1 Tax=Nocardia cyriacigeorgica TaxID=135487 RepID=UPI001E47C9D4